MNDDFITWYPKSVLSEAKLITKYCLNCFDSGVSWQESEIDGVAIVNIPRGQPENNFNAPVILPNPVVVVQPTRRAGKIHRSHIRVSEPYELHIPELN